MKEATTCTTCSDRIETIVELVTHGCEEVLDAVDLTSSERSTLLYTESQCVDGDGSLDDRHMNYEDHQNILIFQAAGWMVVEEFEVQEMSDRGWEVAAECRKMRSEL